MFKNLFKPKWKSQKPQVRKLAIEQLNLEKDDDRQTLVILAKEDTDQDVRKEAISRVDELDILTSLLEKTENEPIKDSIYHRIGVVISINGDAEASKGVEEKIKILSGLGEPMIFNYVVKNSTQVEVQLAAINKIEVQESLEDLALNARVVRVRQKATERLVDIGGLQRVANSAKGKDKSVYRIAKDKLDLIRDEVNQRKEEAVECERLCVAIEKHSQASLEPLYEQKAALLYKQWQSLESEYKTNFESRVVEAWQRCDEAIANYTSEEKQRQLDGELHNNALEEQLETCKVLEDAFDLVKQNSEMQGSDLPAIEGLLSTQKNRWEEAASVLQAPEEVKGRYELGAIKLAEYVDAARQLFEGEEAIAQVLTEVESLNDDDISGIRKKKRQLDGMVRKYSWPSLLAEPLAIISLNKAVDQIKTLEEKAKNSQNKVIEDIKNAIAKLNENLQEGALKSANKRIRDVQHLLKKIPAKEAEYYHNELKSFTGRLNELRDWQGYATTPKKERLCEQMEGLIESDIDPQDKADQIKQMQHEWKALGPSDIGKEKALWERFKVAGDKAFEPCREYFSNLATIREENFKKRKVLCDQLDTYIKNNNWDGANWKAVLETLQLAKSEWRSYAPVERKSSRDLQERFNQLLHVIQSKLDEERVINVKLREKVIAEAVALADVDDMQKAVTEAKNLQEKWRKIGMVQRKDDQRLWKEFRSACDIVFDRRQQKWEDLNEQRSYNQKTVEELCQQIEQALMLSSQEVIEQKHLVFNLKEQFEKSQPLPKEVADQLKKQFLSLAKQFEKKVAGARTSLLAQRYEGLWQQAMISAELEDVVLKQQLDDMKLRDFRDQWNEVGDLPDDLVVSMNARFDNAVNAHTTGDIEGFAAVLEGHNELCRQLTIRMEILAGEESPAEDKSYRMELQVNRLNQGMGVNGAQNAVQQRKQLEADWCCNGPINQDVVAPWLQRFKSAMSKVA